MKHMIPMLALLGILVSGCIIIRIGESDTCPTCGAKKAAKHPAAASQDTAAASSWLNIDFGPAAGSPSGQTGPAAVGADGDFWNTVGRAFQDDYTIEALKDVRGQVSPVSVHMVNLGGAWGFSGRLGMKSPMLDDFNYPANNKGGNSRVILQHVPPGTYDLLLYGHGEKVAYFGDYQVRVGSKDYGRKTTFAPDNNGSDKEWIEGRQYVRFKDIKVSPGDDLEVLIRPGEEVIADYGRPIRDAIIAGLQLVPASSL